MSELEHSPSRSPTPPLSYAAGLYKFSNIFRFLVFFFFHFPMCTPFLSLVVKDEIDYENVDDIELFIYGDTPNIDAPYGGQFRLFFRI